MIFVLLFLLAIIGYFLYAFVDWEALKKKVKYQSSIESKYNRFSSEQIKQLYKELLEINKTLVSLEIDVKKARQRAKDFGGIMPQKISQNLLIREMAVELKIEEFEKRYDVKLEKKYLNNDVKYLHRFI